MEKVTYAWKNKISLTMIYADSVSFFTSIDDRIQKYSSMFGFPWTNPWVNFSRVYKKMSALLWLRVYNHDFGLYLVQLHKVCLDIPDALLTICFRHVSCDMQISQIS